MNSSAAAEGAAEGAASLVGEVLGVQLFSDGRVVRSSKPVVPETPADPTFTDGVASKDVVIDQKKGLSARIFLPVSVVRAAEKESSRKQIPVLVYYHGGGFVEFQPSSTIFHNLCNNVAPKLGLLIVSVSYRLAPEHRLPVAFEDSFEALKWIQQQAKRYESGEEGEDLEPWLKYADQSNCLLMGHSAGATICHQMVLKASEYDLSPLKIKGVIPVMPFFGAVERAVRRLKSLKEPGELTLEVSSTLWLLSLPEGAAETEHPCSRCPSVEDVVDVNIPPVLVVVGTKDVLYRKQIEYVEVLRKTGKDVQLLQYENYGHGVPFPEVEDKMHNSYSEMVQFMDKCFR